MSDEESKTTTVIKAGSQGVTSAVMPYVAIGVVGYILLKKVGDLDIGSSFTNSANSVVERVTDTVTETITNVSDTIRITDEKITYGGEVARIEDAGSFNGVTIPSSTVFVKKNLKESFQGSPSGNVIMKERDVKGISGKETLYIAPNLEYFKPVLTPEEFRLEQAGMRVDALKALSKAQNRKTSTPANVSGSSGDVNKISTGNSDSKTTITTSKTGRKHYDVGKGEKVKVRAFS